ncbi:MAG: peptidylprolyl isomerase, partial [Bacteroidetes bacterium]|nr:peptidylprolyl isomerase [Bacteroidota bacterium]
MTEEEETAAKAKANEIYSKLVAGEDFVELAKQYSEDRGTSNKGGILPWFGTGRMVPEFDSATYLLKTNGDFSKPVRTLYGYHIIKLMDKKPIPTWDDAKSELKVRIQKDGRSRLSKLAVISRIKKDYKFKESRKTIAALYPLIDSSFFAGKWEAPKVNNLTKKMFNIGKNIYTQNDFAKFIESHQTPNVIGSIEVLVNKQYDAFVEDECVKYENERLEDKYPEFKALMKEYRDGILLFELTDQKVWSKAVKDTSGLKAFYDQNKLKYMWGKRADADIYVCKDAAAAEKVAVLLKELAPASDTLNIPKAIQSKINMDSQLNVKIETGLFQVEDHPALSKFAWQEGVSGPISADNSAVLVFIRGIELPRPKTLEEAKGIITADYQTNLENAWIVALKQKYPVKVNEQVLKDIK